MSPELIAAFVAFAFVTSVTPGPNNLMLLASGVNYGFFRTIPHMLGIGIGFTVMIVLVGLGLGQIFAQAPLLQLAFKVASVVYMVWLAWKIAKSGPVKSGDVSGIEHKPMTFMQAALFQWVNPKAWAMSLTAVAAYTAPANYIPSLLTVAAVFGCINLPTVSTWTLFGVGLRSLLQDPVRVRVFNIVMAVLLLLSLYPILVDGIAGHDLPMPKA